MEEDEAALAAEAERLRGAGEGEKARLAAVLFRLAESVESRAAGPRRREVVQLKQEALRAQLEAHGMAHADSARALLSTALTLAADPAHCDSALLMLSQASAVCADLPDADRLAASCRAAAGRCHARLGRPVEAAQEILAGVASLAKAGEAPGSRATLEARLQAVSLLASAGRHDEALAAADAGRVDADAAEDADLDARLRSAAAAACASAGRVEEAAERYREASARGRLPAPAFEAMMRTLLMVGDAGAAREEAVRHGKRPDAQDEALYEAYGVPPPPPPGVRAAMDRGAELGGEGRWEEAAASYTEALGEASAPRLRAVVLMSRGNCRGRLGRHADALADAREAVAADSTVLGVHALLAEALTGVGRAAEASDAYKAHGTALYARRGPAAAAAALEAYRRAARADPENAAAHSNCGVMLALLGDADEAKDAFRRAARLADAQGNEALAAKARKRLAALEGGGN